jgi:hypothetical protein
VSQLNSTLEKLERARKQLLRAAAEIPGESWMTAPKEGAWSAAEVVAHLMGVESAVVAGAQRILKKEPKSIPLLKRFSFPPALVERRTIRLQSPLPVDERLLAAKETMLELFAETRERTLKLMEETKNRDLRVYRWKHPVLGMLHAYGWFSFLASHEIRHAKQIQEIAGSLRKTVAGLQK